MNIIIDPDFSIVILNFNKILHFDQPKQFKVSWKVRSHYIEYIGVGKSSGQIVLTFGITQEYSRTCSYFYEDNSQVDWYVQYKVSHRHCGPYSVWYLTDWKFMVRLQPTFSAVLVRLHPFSYCNIRMPEYWLCTTLGWNWLRNCRDIGFHLKEGHPRPLPNVYTDSFEDPS